MDDLDNIVLSDRLLIREIANKVASLVSLQHPQTTFYMHGEEYHVVPNRLAGGSIDKTLRLWYNVLN